MRWTRLTLLATLAIGCGGPPRAADADAAPDGMPDSTPDGMPDATPDAPPPDAMPACPIHASQGYATIDPVFGTKQVTLPVQLGLYRAVRDGHGRLILQVNDANFGTPMTTESLVRLMPDGTIDDTFGDHGWVSIAPPPSPATMAPIEDLVVDDAGRIYYETYDDPGTEDTVIVRLTSHGAPDLSWGTIGDGTVHFTGLFNLGREQWIVAGGQLVVSTGGGVARFAENGTVRSQVRDPGGNNVTYVAGDADTTYVGTEHDFVDAFTADGAPIATFGTDGSTTVHSGVGRDWGVFGLALGASGGVDVLIDDGDPSPSGIVRLTASGAFDTSYGDGGVASIHNANLYGLVRRCDDVDIAGGLDTSLVVFDAHGALGTGGSHPGAHALYDPSTGQYVLVTGTSTDPPSAPLAITISHLMP